MKYLTILSMVVLSGCSSLTLQPTPTPSASPVASPSPVVTPIPSPAPTQDISACANYNWKDRGKAPMGYLRGLQAVFQRAKTRAILPVGPAATDALTWYGLPNTLTALYTLMVGEGMRESSGNYYEGRDTSAGAETPEETETGLFQFSYNSFDASPLLAKLYQEYQASPSQCLLSTFQQGVGVHSSTNYGTGAAYDFQKFSKDCPAFAAEYAAVLFKVLRKHFGPLNTKAAEYVKACEVLFQ